MQELVQKIEFFLIQNPTHALHIYQGENSLKKTKAPKQYWTQEDVEGLFGSVENLLKSLSKKGFTNGTKIQLVRLYANGGKHNIGEPMVLNFPNQITEKEEVTNQMQENHNSLNTINTMQPQPAFMGQPQYGMGFTQVPTSDFVSLKVKEERMDDLKNENYRLKEEIAETKSELRKERDEKRSLQLRLDTLEEKHSLEMKKAELDRKSFFESPGFEKVSETLGTILPPIIQSQTQKSSGGLAGADLSPIKQQFVMLIQNNELTDRELQLCLKFIENQRSKKQKIEQENGQ